MKHWNNLVYLVKHKWYVFLAGLRTHAPLWRLIIHDWSKLTPAEWGPYADNFFAPKPKRRERCDCTSCETIRLNFKRAWLHHIHLNPHHWQHWVHNDGTLFMMPEDLVREMVADWAGAGRAITGKWEVRKWYESNKDQMQIHTSTRELVERLLKCYF